MLLSIFANNLLPLLQQGLIKVIQQELPDIAPMEDEDGEGKYGSKGIPLDGKLWKELC